MASPFNSACTAAARTPRACSCCTVSCASRSEREYARPRARRRPRNAAQSPRRVPSPPPVIKTTLPASSITASPASARPERTARRRRAKDQSNGWFSLNTISTSSGRMPMASRARVTNRPVQRLLFGGRATAAQGDANGHEFRTAREAQVGRIVNEIRARVDLDGLKAIVFWHGRRSAPRAR